MRLGATGATLVAVLLTGSVLLASRPAIDGTSASVTVSMQAQTAPACAPIDSAWAIAIHVTDAVTGKPVSHVSASSDLWARGATDSTGWACFRGLVEKEETLHMSRRGYREQSVTLKGTPGQVVRHEVRFHRVTRPCCDLRGQWKITFQLLVPAQMHPQPAGRSATGEVTLGPRYHPADEGDHLDSLVRVVHGLHQVDFTPFFGGPVARDVSTSVFGTGPDLLREVMAMVPMSDSVAITFIPRMTHGSLSLDGRIRADTIRGAWVQNAYCCGARGQFVMTRIGPVDTMPVASPSPTRSARPGRREMAGAPPITSPPGEIPGGRWRPELAIAPGGRLWLAHGGLFVADSLHGAWRRVLGGETDPVEADELRIGLDMAFVGSRIAIIGLDSRYPVTRAPVLYRTENAGASWTSFALSDVRDVDAISAIGPSVWVVTTRTDRGAGLARSHDGGSTWIETRLPEALHWVARLHRTSDSTAFIATMGDSVGAALWRTTDAGHSWSPVPTPVDQGLHRSRGTRVEEIATTAAWLVVREHGRVFASPTSDIRWQPLGGVDHIASELGVDSVFVLMDSMHPALLDRNLRIVWRGDRPLPIQKRDDIEQVIFRGGSGYVSETNGAIHEIRNGTSRVVRSRGRAP